MLTCNADEFPEYCPAEGQILDGLISEFSLPENEANVIDCHQALIRCGANSEVSDNGSMDISDMKERYGVNTGQYDDSMEAAWIRGRTWAGSNPDAKLPKKP